MIKTICRPGQVINAGNMIEGCEGIDHRSWTATAPYVRTSSIIAVYAATAPPEECPEHEQAGVSTYIRTWILG